MTLIRRPSFGLKRPPAWGLYLGVVAVLIAVYMSTDNDGFRSLLYNSHSTVAAAIIGLCAWRLRPVGRAAWFLIAAGIGAFSAGDWIWTTYEHIWHVEAPFPSLADPVYLAGAALLALGMWRLVSARGTGRGDLQDTAIAC
jgi:hypothetical protein